MVGFCYGAVGGAERVGRACLGQDWNGQGGAGQGRWAVAYMVISVATLRYFIIGLIILT